MTRRHLIRTTIAITALGLALLYGCAADEILTPDPAFVESDPGPALEALRTAYETMDIEAYEALLHADFRFIFADADKAAFAREDDLASTERMFSGEDRKNSSGGDAPAVASIEFQRLEVLDEWSPADDGEVDWSEAEDVRRARIAYGFVLHLKNGTLVNAHGLQIVYVAPTAVEDEDGALRWRWQLLGQRDL